MGKRRKHARQSTMWVATADLPQSAGHPFYEKLHRMLGFENALAEVGWSWSASLGSLPPGQRILPPEPLFSKLEEGRFPETGEIRAHL